MKVIGGFLKFIAYLLMVLFVVFMPLSLLSRNVGKTLYNPSDLLKVAQENIFDANIIANIAEGLIEENQVIQDAEGDNLFANVLLIGINNLSHENWVDIINLIAPPQVISQSFDQILDSYYRWIDGRSAVPLIQVNLSQWKTNTIENTIPILEIIMKEIRACNPDEIEHYNRIRLSGNYADIPPCRPPEPNYSWILETGAKEAPEFMLFLPSHIDNSNALSQRTRDPIEFKQNFLRSITIMRAGWILLLVLFVVAVPMGARSISDIFKWSGWPLLLAGLWGLLIAFLLLIFTGTIIASMGGLILGNIPNAVINQIEAAGVAFVQFFQRPLLVQSAIMFGFGGMALIIAFIVGRNQTGQTPAPQPAAVVPPKQAIEDDDSSPTGMFG